MRILVLEDERDIAEAVVEALTDDHHLVTWASDAATAETAAARGIDLAILDVIVGDDDDAGFDLATALRRGGFLGPIVFTTARDAVDDRVRGLDLGGDDYLVKPYSLTELRARVRALGRREAPTKEAAIARGPLRVDTAAKRVAWDGREVELSAREYALIELLARFPDRTFATAELQERVFPDAGLGGSIVRVYVRQLRQKLGPDAIATVSGGYRVGPA